MGSQKNKKETNNEFRASANFCARTEKKAT
jgi:hypothetical protein